MEACFASLALAHGRMVKGSFSKAMRRMLTAALMLAANLLSPTAGVKVAG
jgi:hypothetical protein